LFKAFFSDPEKGYFTGLFILFKIKNFQDASLPPTYFHNYLLPVEKLLNLLFLSLF